MNPCSSSEKEEEEEASSLCFDAISLVSLQPRLVFSSSSALSPPAAFFISATFRTRHELSPISSGSYCITSSTLWQTERSIVTFFRTAALYKLEDLLFLKTSCSISTAKDSVSQLRDENREQFGEGYFHFCSKIKMYNHYVWVCIITWMGRLPPGGHIVPPARGTGSALWPEISCKTHL